MSTTSQTISNRRGRLQLLLSVAVVAWLSMVVMPCAVLAADGAINSESPLVEVTKPDCHGIEASSSPSETTSCCCDPLTISNGEAPKTQRADLVAAAPSIELVPLVAVSSVASARTYPPPMRTAGPPVYLVTQRFRI